MTPGALGAAREADSRHDVAAELYDRFAVLLWEHDREAAVRTAVEEELHTAFVVVTHDCAVAQQTDRILEVQDGRLLQAVRNANLDPAPGDVRSAAAEAVWPE